MSKIKFFVVALAVSLSFLTGSAQAQSPCDNELREQLVAAARKTGIEVNADDIVTSVGEGVTLATTTVAGYEAVPGSALPEGVNAGYIYFEAEGSGIPAGFYALRASAEASALTVGEFPGRVELVSPDGKVAATLPATVDAFSLEVPRPLPFPRTTIQQDLQKTDDAGNGTIGAKRIRWTITITIRCPNGTTIRITIRF